MSYLAAGHGVALRQGAVSITGWLVSGAVWTAVGWGASRTALALGMLAIARQLGESGYGQFATLQSTIGLLSVLAAVTFGATATRYVAYYRETDPTRTLNVVVLLFMAASVIGVTCTWQLTMWSGWFATNFLGGVGAARAVRLASWLVLIQSIEGLVTGMLAAYGRFRNLATVNVAQATVTVPLLIVLTNRFHLEGAVGAMLAGGLMSVIASCAALYRIRAAIFPCFVPLKVRPFSETRVLLDFSFPTMLNSIVIHLGLLTTLAVLGRSKMGLAAAGVFGLGRQIGTWVQLGPQIILRAALPLLAKEMSKDLSRAASVTKLLHKAYVVTCFPLSVFAVWWLPSLIRLVGPGFSNECFSVGLLVVGSTIGVAWGASELSLIAAGRVWINCGLNGLWNLTSVCGALIAARNGSTWLAASGVCVGQLLASAAGNRMLTSIYGRPVIRAWLTDSLALGLLALPVLLRLRLWWAALGCSAAVLVWLQRCFFRAIVLPAFRRTKL